jgi:pyruvate ferredoxin oxidoreductase alpha subunit
MAYRLAEDAQIRLPVLVNLDGFYLSFTREPVVLPDIETVRRFLPPFEAGTIRFRASRPTSQAVAVLGGGPYSYFRYETHLAAMNGLAVYDSITAEFEAAFGRRHEAVEAYCVDDAEIVLVMIGSFATKLKPVVDRLRRSGIAVGLLRPRLLRPLPIQRLRELLSGKRGVGVIDQNLSIGRGGILHNEIASALYGTPQAPPIVASFVGGLGGRDIRAEEFFEIVAEVERAVKSGVTPPPRFLFTETELREVRKLQAIAGVERTELRGGT